MQNIYPYSDLANIILDLDDRYQCKYPCYETVRTINTAIQYIEHETEFVQFYTVTENQAIQI